VPGQGFSRYLGTGPDPLTSARAAPHSRQARLAATPDSASLEEVRRWLTATK
jgi:hypothetical protein